MREEKHRATDRASSVQLFCQEPCQEPATCPQHSSGATRSHHCCSQGRALTTSPCRPFSYLLLSFGAFPNNSFWRQRKRSLMQKVTRALNTAMRGPEHSQNRGSNREPVSLVPLPQLTSTVRDLEFAGLSAFLASLGGGHGCSECLHNFMEQLWV